MLPQVEEAGLPTGALWREATGLQALAPSPRLLLIDGNNLMGSRGVPRARERGMIPSK